jgi:hypothetical protein
MVDRLLTEYVVILNSTLNIFLVKTSQIKIFYLIINSINSL